jgi:hypothetical protein
MMLFTFTILTIIRAAEMVYMISGSNQYNKLLHFDDALLFMISEIVQA